MTDPSDSEKPATTRREMLAGGIAAGATLALGTPQTAQAMPAPLAVECLPDGLLIRHATHVVEVRVTHPGIASVVKCSADRLAASRGLFPLGREAPVRFAQTPTSITVIGDGIRVTLDRRTGLLAFTDGRGGIAEAPATPPPAGVAISRTQAFAIGATESLHGLGQFRDPVFDYRNQDVFLAQANSDAVNPFLLSSGGWGLLWETGTAAHFRSRGASIAFHSVAGDLIRYHVCLGDGAGGVIARYRALTGEAVLLPKWAYGYWQSKERYASQAELTGVVDEYRRRGLPLDAVVLDWRYWGEDTRFSGMRFDPKTFPDPRAMVRHVHEADAHLLVSIWPAFGPDTAIHHEMAAAGLLFPGRHWGGGRVFDATSPRARAIYWRYIRQGLIDIGFDGLWTDGNGPEFMSTGDRYGTAASFARNAREAAGPIDENLLTYSWYQSKGLADAMRRDVPAKRPVILSRSAYAGQQAAGVVTWSGDIFASWQTLRNQVIAAINMSLSGLPWWTCDIGGFLVTHRFPDGLADPAYTELYVRWFQFAAFLPVFRAHGTQVPRELWRFGEPGTPVYDALAAALELRYRLLPYIYSLADGVRAGGAMLHALATEFPHDPACRDRADGYMFGADLLVRVVDRPLLHAPTDIQEFIPNTAVKGLDAPAARIEYFEGVDFARAVGERLTDDLKMTWFGDLPEALRGKPYSARWTGRIVATESGRHRLVVTGKGAIRLMIDDRMLIDGHGEQARADGANGGVSFKGHEGDGRWTADIDLVAGRSYPFRLEQRQPTPDAVSLWVEWITPTLRRLATPTGARTVAVYLPTGRDWYDFHTARRHPGGRTITVDAPLDRAPLFARAGAIVPMASGLTRATQTVDRLTIRVFAGADGRFTLYDDAGDGQEHLAGQASRVTFEWNDRASVLRIGKRQGRYAGMVERLRLDIVVEDGTRARTSVVRYDGTARNVMLT